MAVAGVGGSAETSTEAERLRMLRKAAHTAAAPPVGAYPDVSDPIALGQSVVASGADSGEGDRAAAAEAENEPRMSADASRVQWLRIAKYKEECAAASARPIDVEVAQFITMFGGAQAPGGLRCCALVGSSSSFLGKGLGPEIDSFDTVIRVNRIPSPGFYADFGKRADIVFVNDQHWFRPTIPVLGRPDVNCTQTESCNFTVILSAWQPYPERNWSNISRFWASAHCPVGRETNDVADSLRGYLPWQPGKRDHYHASGGLHAFVTMASHCDFMRLFGFGGPQTTVDGHAVSSFHNFSAEQELMAVIGRGDAQKLKSILKKAKKSRQDVPKWLQEYLKKRLRGRSAITEV